jgi:hypothetical protein
MDDSTERSIEYLLLFIKESLKFILFGFFKRCRIITHILLNIKKNFQNDSKESIFADMLSSNMRWVFLTIRTCIDKVSERIVRQRAYFQNRHGSDSLLQANERLPIMNDLRPFTVII